ncbi:MAG: ASKHA domain-containing protein [Chloroflexota bacterium]|nr:ASKHA domain-containing protein [Chloroflexota bacterium]
MAEAASEAGLPLQFPCDGKGYCGRCKVRFLKGPPAPGPWDQLHLEPDQLQAGARLACCARLTDDAILTTPKQAAPVMLDGRLTPYRLCPPSQRAVVRVTESNSAPEVAALLPTVALGRAPRELTLHLLEDEVRRVELGANRSPHLGVAAVLSTTEACGWLLDLETGAELTRGCIRVESWGGRQADGDTALSIVRRLVRSLNIASRTRSEHVADTVVAFENSSYGPFREDRCRPVGSGVDTLVDVVAATAVAVGAERLESALLVSLRPVPWLCCLSAGQAWMTTVSSWAPKPDLFTSTAAPDEAQSAEKAGPEHTLGRVVDDIVRLRRAGLIDAAGRFVDGGAEGQGEAGGESSRGRIASDSALAVTTAHIRAVQWLSALLGAACDALLQAADLSSEDLERVVLAGGEAAGLSPGSVSALRMVPDVSPSRIVSCPDALGQGVRLAALSTEANGAIRALASRLTHLEERAVSPSWAERLYLRLREDGPLLDDNSGTLLDFSTRGSVGIGRRA